MKRLILGALLGAVCAVGGAFAQGAPANAPMAGGPAGGMNGPPANIEELKGVQWLFVQVADSITVTDKTITLKGVAPQVIMFADRPERITGDASTATFIKIWNEGKDSFQKDPPNATLSVTVNGEPNLSVIELSNPVLSGDTLTYDYKLLSEDKPLSGANASLFIDWWHYHRWWGPGPGRWGGGGCWRGPLGGLHCRW